MTRAFPPYPSNLLSARYTMEADVFYQVQRREESGQIRVTWHRDPNNPTIELIARPILGGGIRVVGSMERWDEEYGPIDWIKLQTATELSKRNRLYNIRDKRTGRHLWEDNELDGPGFVPMWFDIVGVMPIMDPFGRLLEYDSLATKVKNKEIGTVNW